MKITGTSRWFFVVFALGWGAALPSTAQQKKSSRIDLIWEIADSRASRQLDQWFEDGDFPRCVQLLRMRAELYPSDYEVNTDLGWMLENTEEYGEALATYVRFREKNQDNVEAAYPEANYYFMKRLYARIPALLEGTLDKRPHPNSFRILAHSYERLGLFLDSQRVWKSLLSITPTDGAAKNNLTRVEKKMSGEIPVKVQEKDKK